MKAFITVGCKTDHGGIILLGDSSFIVEGKAVHLDGMTHYCPKCQIQSKAIASNRVFFTVNGKSIVVANDTSTCGAKFLKISDLVVMDNGNGLGISQKSLNSTNSFVVESEAEYGQRFLLQDESTGEPLANICYEISKNDEVIHGITDNDGFTQFITSNKAEKIELRIISKDHTHE